MARKTKTPTPEAVQPELPFEETAPVEKKTRAPKPPITKDSATSILADAKKLPKVQAGFDKLAEKFAKLHDDHQTLKKTISDLKNLAKAERKNGHEAGYKEGFADGGKTALKNAAGMLKGLI